MERWCALPLDDTLLDVLRKASAAYARERLALGEIHTSQGYVMCDEVGHPYNPDTLTRIFRKIVKRSGCRVLT